MAPRVHEPPLVCPECRSRFSGEARFCPDCHLPLVLEADGEVTPPVSERHERARKVKPQLSEGELVKVAWARNQAEAEFIQGLLLEEGVPSLLRRSPGSTSRTSWPPDPGMSWCRCPGPTPPGRSCSEPT